MSDNETEQATPKDLLKGALAHYDDVSSRACAWSSSVPHALKFYFGMLDAGWFDDAVDGTLPQPPQAFLDFWHEAIWSNEDLRNRLAFEYMDLTPPDYDWGEKVGIKGVWFGNVDDSGKNPTWYPLTDKFCGYKCLRNMLASRKDTGTQE